MFDAIQNSRYWPFLRATLALAFLAFAVVIAHAQTSAPPDFAGGAPTEGETGDDDQAKQSRIREGVQLKEQVGYFRVTGSRVTFFDESGENRLVGLENLNLERIAYVVADNPTQMMWNVSGIVTEYQGDNYVLVTRAVLATPDNSGSEKSSAGPDRSAAPGR